MDTKLRLKEIEIDSFKSFGKKTVVPFLPGFTAIAGPNGSGKSNIVDSILFCLGLSSSRAMRAERLPDLINNLSGKKEAYVTVRFTSDSDSENDEIEVTRKIKVKENSYSSNYFMDGRPCTLTEIHDRLSKYKVSSHGYNVVMQGDVTSIISMSLNDRRKIIDELAGVADFDRKIDLARNELGKVEETIEKENIILHELSGRLKQLENERNEALKYATLKDELKELEKHCLAARISKVEGELSGLKEENETLRAKRTENITALGKLNDEIEKDKETLTEIEVEVENITSERQKKILEEVEATKIEISQNQSSVDFLNKQIKDHEDNKQNLQKEVDSLDKKINDIERKKKKKLREKEEVEKEIKKHNVGYLEIQDKLKSKGQNQSQSTTKILEVQEKINKLKQSREDLVTKKTRNEEQLTHLKEDLEKAKEDGERALTELQESTQNSDFKNSRLNQLIQKKTALQRHVSKLKAEEIETREEMNERVKKLSRLERELDKLEVHKQVVKESNMGAAVDAIMNSGIKGVQGSLAQLGYVDSKYTTAIEVAGGGRLKSVVVDNDSIAAKCIELLKSSKSGRATLLPLNKLREAPTVLPVNQRGVVGSAIELIRFDEKYRDAFYYAFGDTLVIDNLDNARKLIGKYRMVTLDGELLEKSGAVTGGSMSKRPSAFGKSGEQEQARLESEVEKLKDYIEQLNDDIKELGNQVEEAKNEFDELKTEIAKEEANSSTLVESIEKLKKTSEESKKKVAEYSETIEQLNAEFSKLDEKINSKDQEITNLEVDLQQVAANVKDKSLESIVTEGQDYELKIKDAQDRLHEIQTELKSFDVESDFNTKGKEEYVLKLENSDKEIERIKGELPEHEAKLKELEEKVAKLSEESETESKKLSELNTKRNEISSGLIKKGEQKGEFQQSIEQLAERITGIELRIREIEPDLAELKEKFKEQVEDEAYVPPEDIDLEKITREIDVIERKMKSLEPINMRAIEEYDTVSVRKEEIDNKLTSLREEKEVISNKINSYNDQKKVTFYETFEGVNKHFQEIFHDLSFGHGELALENAEDPFAGGLIIRARPRDKKMQRLEAMSGGEKSLTALSFMFGLQRYSPAPFYAFDEVDAPLDGINAERLARMVKKLSGDAQFVVVSHRRPMLERSDQAIGVTLRSDGYSQILGVQREKSKEDEPKQEAVSA